MKTKDKVKQEHYLKKELLSETRLYRINIDDISKV